MRGLDLRKFKKVSGDKNQSVLKHQDGHSITVVHAPLSKAYRQQLEALPVAKEPKKMAEGGYVDTVDSDDPIYTAVKGPKAKNPNNEGDDYSSRPVSQGNAAPDQDKAKNDDYERQKAAFNSQMNQPVQEFADGGEAAPLEIEKLDAEPPTIDMAQMPAAEATSANPGTPMAQNIGHAIGSALSAVLKNTVENPANPIGGVIQTAKAAMPAVQGMVQGAAGQPLAPIPTMEDAPAARQPSAAPAPTPVAVVETPPQESPGVPQMGSSQGSDLLTAVDNQSRAEAKAYQGAQDAQKQIMLGYQQQLAKLNADRDQIMKEYKEEKIDPHHFWDSKSTLGKIGTIVGLIGGGIGSGLLHQDPTAFLQQQIDKDIDAQKANLGKKQSLLDYNLKQFNNLKDATEMTRIMQMDQVKDQLGLAAAKAGDPVRKSEVLGKVAAYQKEIDDRTYRLAATRALSQINGQGAGSPGGPGINPHTVEQSLNALRTLDPAKAKEVEQRVIPNVGVASVPVNDKTREAFAAGHTFIQQMDQLEAFRKEHRGAMVGAAADEGHRLAELARNSFRIAQGEGVFKEGSKQFNEKLIPDPTQIDMMGKNQRAYSAMKDQAVREVKDKMAIHGIQPFQGSIFTPQADKFLNWAKSNPNDPRAQAILRNSRGK